jgi:hypothetical protein
MAGDIKLKAGSTQTLANANGPAVSNDAAGAAGTDLDNTTALAEYVSFELDAGFGSSVTALEDVDLYLVPKLDGHSTVSAFPLRRDVLHPYDRYVGPENDS